MNPKSNKVLLAIAGVVVVVIAVTAWLAGRPVAQIDDSKPEGVVQAFVKASLARDFTSAATYLDPSSPCTLADFDIAGIPSTARVDLQKVTATADAATVDVQVRQGSGGLLDSGYTEVHTYRVTKVKGAWKLAGSPWPLNYCQKSK